MGTKSKLSLFSIILVGSAMAQNLVTSSASAPPAPAMTGPAYEISTGYTYLATPIPGAGQVHLNGVDASGSIEWSPRWGATLDTDFLRTSNVPGTSHQAYMVNIQGGPQFYLFEHRNTRVLVRALAGSALVDGAAPDNKTGFYHGWLVRPSFAAGGGIEQAVSSQFALRFNGDYLRTSFYDATGAVVPQNNLKMTVSIVFRKRTGRVASW